MPFNRLSSASNFIDDEGADDNAAHRNNRGLKFAVRRVNQDWLASCSPFTFRTSNPKRPYPLPIFADHGLIKFPGRRDPACFIYLADSREPYKSDESYCKSVLGLMEKHWRMEPAQVSAPAASSLYPAGAGRKSSRAAAVAL